MTNIIPRLKWVWIACSCRFWTILFYYIISFHGFHKSESQSRSLFSSIISFHGWHKCDSQSYYPYSIANIEKFKNFLLTVFMLTIGFWVKFYLYSTSLDLGYFISVPTIPTPYYIVITVAFIVAITVGSGDSISASVWCW